MAAVLQIMHDSGSECLAALLGALCPAVAPLNGLSLEGRKSTWSCTLIAGTKYRIVVSSDLCTIQCWTVRHIEMTSQGLCLVFTSRRRWKPSIPTLART